MAQVVPSEIPTTAAREARGIELAETYLRDPENSEVREKLAKYCLQRITVIARGLVYGRGLYFRSYGPDMFFEDLVSMASEKYTIGIGSLKNPPKLHAWLKAMVRCALIDLFRQMRGKGKEPKPEPVPLWKTVTDGEEFIVVDQDRTRAELLPHLPVSTLVTIDADAWERQFGSGEFLVKVLEKHAEDSPDSAACVQKTWEDEDVESIAQERRCSPRTVYRLLHHDNDQIRRIAKAIAGMEEPETVDPRRK